MGIKDKRELNIIKKGILIIYALYSYIYGNFITFNVNDETLTGSVSFGLNNTILGLTISAILCLLLLYFCFQENKLAITLIFVGSSLNVIFSLMMIETSNLSLYNVLVIIEIIISVVVAYLLRPLA